MKIAIYLALLVGLAIGPAYWIYGKFYSGQSAQRITLVRNDVGIYSSAAFRITPAMAPAGVIMTASASFAPNMPDDQPPQVGYEARLSKDGVPFNVAKFALKASSTGNTNPTFKERLFYLEAPQDGMFTFELEAKTPQTMQLDSVTLEINANIREPDGRIVSAGMVLAIVAVLILLI